ncbi:hypothetical protein [Sphingomicrobium lutaoense]|uniref:Uncharacterized protein n=1 Tax=Sphingomicrobium lutaoense TaxID=515949 RepID=A0A839Z2M2_9SPHN|nr:hypothetical protein [Sphingomicrobium lutaoense]MBB3764003.1 hypothetical protein [Sphingomicrobium lutaoense]
MRIARLMGGARDDWWVIGSAAVLLHGSDPGGVADVDILLSEKDALKLLEPRGIPIAAGMSDGLFRSALFARWDGTPLPCEFMAGFQFCQRGDWQRVWPRSREWVEVAGEKLFVPSRDELRTLLLGFGRGKDVQRAACL